VKLKTCVTTLQNLTSKTENEIRLLNVKECFHKGKYKVIILRLGGSGNLRLLNLVSAFTVLEITDIHKRFSPGVNMSLYNPDNHIA
jgi:hypothetical protein